MADTSAIPAEAMELLQKVSASMVVDALAMSNIQGGVIGIWPVRGFEDAKVIGRAFTAHYAPPRADTARMSMYETIAEVPAGSVLVIDAAGQPGHYTGDNVAAWAKKQGIQAIVTHGGVRDIAGLREVGLPVYSSAGPSPRQPNNMVLTAREVPVSIGGALIKPGDIIMADEDGVVVIPAGALDAMMENMKTIFEVEEGMARAIAGGAPAKELTAINAKKKVKK